MTKRPTRRELIIDAALLGAGASLASCFPDTGGEWAESCGHNALTSEPLTGASTVAEAHDPDAVVVETVDNKREVIIEDDLVTSMLEQILTALAGAPEPWPVLLPDFTSGMRIGLKVNCLNPTLPTSLPLTRALVASLKAGLGVTKDDIIVWDRRLDELTAHGFTDESVGARVLGTVNSTTDDSGPGYEECYCTIPGGKRTHLSRILTEETDLTLSVPVLKTHEISGVTAALKNIYGVIDNPARFHNDLNTALPALYALAPIRERIRLTIVDALVAVTAGGTASNHDTVPCRLFASQDPVAIDSYALDLVNRLRAEKNVGLAEVPANSLAWLDNARDLGLGSREVQLVTG